jgi:hypothetical protein
MEVWHGGVPEHYASHLPDQAGQQAPRHIEPWCRYSVESHACFALVSLGGGVFKSQGWRDRFFWWFLDKVNRRIILQNDILLKKMPDKKDTNLWFWFLMNISIFSNDNSK